MNKPSFVYVTYIRSTPERIWDAITDELVAGDSHAWTVQQARNAGAAAQSHTAQRQAMSFAVHRIFLVGLHQRRNVVLLLCSRSIRLPRRLTMRPAMYHLSISAVRADALFVSALQRSEELSTGQVRQAIASAVRAFGSRGCVERVAQEFGDHPDTAVVRMRWARMVEAEAFGSSGPHLDQATLPVRRSLAGASRAA